MKKPKIQKMEKLVEICMLLVEWERCFDRSHNTENIAYENKIVEELDIALFNNEQSDEHERFLNLLATWMDFDKVKEAIYERIENIMGGK